MKLRSYQTILGLILAGFLATPVPALHAEPATKAAAAGDPAAIMTKVYREAVKTEGSDWLEPAERPKRLSKSLLALWAKADAKEGDEGPIDFDITADTNGLTLESFVVSVPKKNAEATTVDVALGYQKPYYRPEGQAVVTYDFVREDGRWVIDNIRSRRKPIWSVRDLLSLWLKDD